MDEVTYFPEVCELVVLMMEAGALIEDILKVFKIKQKTFDDWRQDHPEFNEAVARGLQYSEAWWEMDIERNLTNRSYDADKACKVMVNNFNWKNF